jgi:hypothetical protein
MRNNIYEMDRLVQDALAQGKRDITVSALALKTLLDLVPRGINGMVNLPWTEPPPLEMLVILARVRHMWPGEVDCIESHRREDEADTASVVLEFRLGGRRWRSSCVLSCCPEEHVSDVVREAIAHFASSADGAL